MNSYPLILMKCSHLEQCDHFKPILCSQLSTDLLVFLISIIHVQKFCFVIVPRNLPWKCYITIYL